MEYQIIFHTRNLKVRQLQLEDFSDFHRLQSDIRVMKFSTGQIMSEAENWQDLNRVIRAYHELHSNLSVWAVERKADGLFLGTGALVLEKPGIFEVGIRLLPDHWGCGYGKEIILSLICHAFGTLEARACCAYVDQDNVRSRKILDRFLTLQGEIEHTSGAGMDLVYLTDLDTFLSQGHAEKINHDQV